MASGKSIVEKKRSEVVIKISVSDSDPDSIRSVDPDPDSESRSRSKTAKMTHKNWKNLIKFHVLKCWMFPVS